MLHHLGEPVEPVGVGHPGLVEVDRRVRIDVDLAVLDTRHERVDTEHPLGERRAISAETLGRRPRHGNTEGLMAAVLLGAGGGVDHDTLAGARWPDEDRGALGAGDDLQGVGLLVAEMSPDPLGHRVACDLTCNRANVVAGHLGELGEPPLDCLLAGAYRERRHQPTLQGEDPALGDHRP